jgi:hypothetical protein
MLTVDQWAKRLSGIKPVGSMTHWQGMEKAKQIFRYQFWHICGQNFLLQ